LIEKRGEDLINENNRSRFYYNSIIELMPKLINDFKDKWWETEDETYVFIKNYSLKEQREKEKQIKLFFEQITDHFLNYPYDLEAQNIWNIEFAIILENGISIFECLGLDRIINLLDNDFLMSTKRFIRRAKKFDESIDNEAIFQALRNVWIVNIIQKIGKQKVATTPSVYGYSMLYPVTDNFLDDDDIDKIYKKQIMNRFKERLEGNKLEASDLYEEKVFELVGSIEVEYKRDIYKNLYESLYAINNGQVKSLLQQKGDFGPYRKDILGISFEKGGSSVLADAYLALGELHYDEILFYFGYGIILQLADDLQDVTEDLNNKHMSIMSMQAGLYSLDKTVNQLINFTQNTLDEAKTFETEDQIEIKNIIFQSIQNLILFSAINSIEYFSKEYKEKLLKSIPFRKSFIDKLAKKWDKKKVLINDRFEGLPVLDIIFEALEVFIEKKNKNNL
jgi:hypothetical protein